MKRGIIYTVLVLVIAVMAFLLVRQSTELQKAESDYYALEAKWLDAKDDLTYTGIGIKETQKELAYWKGKAQECQGALTSSTLRNFKSFNELREFIQTDKTNLLVFRDLEHHLAYNLDTARNYNYYLYTRTLILNAEKQGYVLYPYIRNTYSKQWTCVAFTETDSQFAMYMVHPENDQIDPLSLYTK